MTLYGIHCLKPLNHGKLKCLNCDRESVSAYVLLTVVSRYMQFRAYSLSYALSFYNAMTCKIRVWTICKVKGRAGGDIWRWSSHVTYCALHILLESWTFREEDISLYRCLYLTASVYMQFGVETVQTKIRTVPYVHA
jgi:hypothetical protein